MEKSFKHFAWFLIFAFFVFLNRPLGAQGLNQIPGSVFSTVSPSPTPTSVFGFSSSLSLIPTVTFTPTNIATGTIVLTWTPTPTFTHTLSPTITYTPTITSTPTNTPTGTLTPSNTYTPTFTITLTPTPTPTRTPTVTPTATSTPGVFKFSVSPKPDAQGVINFSWGTTIPADEAFLKIYTSGFRVVREFYFNKDENSDYLPAGTHDFSWDGKDDNKRPLPPANYLCFIDVNAGKKKYEASGKTEIP